eukprot:1894734-Amphidinium_carterae.1
MLQPPWQSLNSECGQQSPPHNRIELIKHKKTRTITTTVCRLESVMFWISNTLQGNCPGPHYSQARSDSHGHGRPVLTFKVPCDSGWNSCKHVIL